MSSLQRPLVRIKRVITIHVFSGGLGATVQQFTTALTRFQSTPSGAAKYIKVVYITNKDIRENIDNRFETPEKFFIWLTSGDLYFITSQGVWLGLITSGTNQFGWTVDRISDNLLILANSNGVVGFPSGRKLLDAVWNGDKDAYIQELDDLAIPTLRISLFEIGTLAEFKAVSLTVSTFMLKLAHFAGSGKFWLKVPFTANNLHYRGRSFSSLVAVVEELERVRKLNLCATFPYMMLQPMILDNTETKVIMHAGVPKYFSLYGSTSSPRVDSDEAIQMFNFATIVHQKLAERCPNIMLDGLTRVDIMKLTDNTLVVNEVEGVDSNYSSAHFHSQLSSVHFLENYWFKVIEDCVQELDSTYL